MLQVLFLNRDLEFHGGVANVLLTLARGHGQSSRANFHFASFMAPSEPMRAAFAELGIELQCIGDGGYAGPAKALRRIIREKNIDFVIACSFKASLVAKLAAVGMRCVVVHYVHGVVLVLEGKLKRTIFAAISKRDPMLFVSKVVQQAHRPPRHRGPAAVLYNSVPDPFEKPETQPYPRSFRSEFGVPDDALLLCYIGAFVAVKDHPTLLRAFEKLDPALNAHLLLIGKSEPGETVTQQVKQMANPRVQIVSPRPDARRILGCIDIYVHTCQCEAFGLAVVEAMLAQRPVVATRAGAFVEYIEDGKTALLGEPGDADSFAAKIELIARDRTLANRLAAAGREDCRKRFSPVATAAQLCDFLESAATSRACNDKLLVEDRCR